MNTAVLHELFKHNLFL